MKKNTMKKVGFIFASMTMSLALVACSDEPTEEKKEAFEAQHIEASYTDVTKFYDEHTGKIVYVMDGTQSGGVAMIDGTAEEGKSSKDFLEIIEVKDIESLYVTVVIARDKDNGNIVIISDGTKSGTIDVQKPKE